MRCTWFLPCFKAAYIVQIAAAKSSTFWWAFVLLYLERGTSWHGVTGAVLKVRRMTLHHFALWFIGRLGLVVIFFSFPWESTLECFKNTLAKWKFRWCWRLACKLQPLSKVRAPFPFLCLYHWHQESTRYLLKQRADTALLSSCNMSCKSKNSSSVTTGSVYIERILVMIIYSVFYCKISPTMWLLCIPFQFIQFK